MERTVNIIKHDLWLEPFEEAINGRYRYALGKKSELTNGKTISIGFCYGISLLWLAQNR